VPWLPWYCPGPRVKVFAVVPKSAVVTAWGMEVSHVGSAAAVVSLAATDMVLETVIHPEHCQGSF